MMKAKRDPLSGTRGEVSARLEELCRELDNHEYVAGTRLRMLAVELTQRPNLRVSLMTYLNESQVPEGGQELEITFADDPFCEPVMIDRDHVGDQCQITWDRWLNIGNETEIGTAADMIASILNTCARFSAKRTPAASVEPNHDSGPRSQEEHRERGPVQGNYRIPGMTAQNT